MLVGLRLAVEYEQRRVRVRGSRHERKPSAGRPSIGTAENLHQLRRELGIIFELVAKEMALIGAADEQEALAILCPAAGMSCKRGAKNEPRCEHNRRTENDEPGKEDAVRHELRD